MKVFLSTMLHQASPAPRTSTKKSKATGKKSTKSQKVVKVQVLNKDGTPAKNKDGTAKIQEAVLYDLDHPDCPDEIVDDIHELFRKCDGKEIKQFLKMRPNYKKAVRQSSLRLRRHANRALNQISKIDDWFLCRPYGGGELYWGVTRLGIPIILGRFGSKIKLPVIG